MPNYRQKLLPLCIAASLLSGPAAAVGIGDVQLQSFLGAPLQAEIPLNHIEDLDTDQLKVRVGSQSDYTALGVDYIYSHSQLKIEPIIKNGRGYVRITTREPVTEPYLNFVLNVQWPQGQLVREFTVLLDPVSATAPAAAVASTHQPAAAAVPEQLALPAIEPAAAAEPVRKARRAPRVEHTAEGGYVTQRGDSLWRIASQMRPAGVAIEQMMSAILATNPSAFINGNPARLKEAVPISLPTTEQIAAATGSLPASTTSAVASTATTPLAAEPATTMAASGELQQENALLKSQVAELTGNVTALNESLGQSEQRLHQLEAQLSDLLQQFQQQRATVAALSGTASAMPGNASAQSGGSMISQVNASELQPAAKARTPWWVHLLYWLGIGGAAMWAIREHFWPRRFALAGARAAVNTVAERVAVPAGNNWRAPEENNRYWHHEEPAKVEAAIEEIVAMPVVDNTFEPVAEDDNPVDASISAGVFVAFGRFDEAERLLQQAIEQAPDRTDLQLQLLDVYAQADRRDAFDALAADIERGPAGPEVIAELAVLRDSYTSKQ